MKAITDQPTRVAADLMDAAAVEGERQSRSTKQHLDHWARVGRSVSAPSSASRLRVAAAQRGELAARELTHHARVVFNAEVNVAITETTRSVRFMPIGDTIDASKTEWRSASYDCHQGPNSEHGAKGSEPRDGSPVGR